MNSLTPLLLDYQQDSSLQQFYAHLDVLSHINMNAIFTFDNPAHDVSILIDIIKASNAQNILPHDIKMPFRLYMAMAACQITLPAHKNLMLQMGKMIAAIEHQQTLNYIDVQQNLLSLLDVIFPQDLKIRAILAALFIASFQGEQLKWFDECINQPDGEINLLISNVIHMNKCALFFQEHQTVLQQVLNPKEYEFVHAAVMENAVLLRHIMNINDDFVIEETIKLMELNRQLADNSSYGQYFTAFDKGLPTEDIIQAASEISKESLIHLNKTLQPMELSIQPY